MYQEWFFRNGLYHFSYGGLISPTAYNEARVEEPNLA